MDPPYLKSTRKALGRYRYRYYSDKQNHVRLLGLLRQEPCQVMVSGYPSALYEELAGDWRSLSVQVIDQAGVVSEKVWSTLRLTGCTGSLRWTKLHRPRIKRIASTCTWSRHYRQMPYAERLAVVSAIMAVEAE